MPWNWKHSLLLKAFLSASFLAAPLGCGESTAPALDDTAPRATSQSLTASDVYLWQTKLYGTHNSYSASDPATWPSPGGPDHKMDIIDQLNWGMRVLEIDVINQDGTVSHGGSPFMTMHCGTIDVCLAQISSWSNANPGHTPIVIFVEFSEDWTGYRTRTLPTYDKIASVYRQQFADHKKITANDAYQSINQLRGKVALAVYRKRSDWDAMVPFIEAHDPDGVEDGYLNNSKIFVASKGIDDKDWRASTSSRTLHFVKADNKDDRWTYPEWKNVPIFYSVNVCRHNDCRAEEGDDARTRDVFFNSGANGIMTNEAEDLGDWAGPPQEAFVNTLRFAGQVDPPARRACFYRHVNYDGLLFCINPGQSIDLGGRWENDQISSVAVFSGADVIVYKDGAYLGETRQFNRSIFDMHRDLGFNDHVSSIRVDPPAPTRNMCFYKNSGFNTLLFCLTPGQSIDLGGTSWNDQISSIAVNNTTATVFKDGGYRGETRRIDRNIFDMHSDLAFNDHVSSIRLDP